MNDRTQQLKNLGLFAVPPVECKPWCRHGDGHPDLTAREDQACGTPSTVIPLHHMQHETKRDKSPEANYLVAYVEQASDRQPEVHVCVGENIGLKLTLEESVSLALALVQQAERVRRSVSGHASVSGELRDEM